MKREISKSLLMTLVLAGSAAQPSLGTIYWTGAKGNSWSVPGNWTGRESGVLCFNENAPNFKTKECLLDCNITENQGLQIFSWSGVDPFVFLCTGGYTYDCTGGTTNNSFQKSRICVGEDSKSAAAFRGGTWKANALFVGPSSNKGCSGWLCMDGRAKATTFEVRNAVNFSESTVISSNATFRTGNIDVNLAYADETTNRTEKAGGAWEIGSNADAGSGRLFVGRASKAAHAEFRHKSGTLSASGGIFIGAFGDGSAGTGYAVFETSGGSVTNQSGAISIGESGRPGDRSVMRVGGGVVGVDTDAYVGNGSSGVLVVDGGEFDASRGSVVLRRGEGIEAGEDCAVILSNGVLRTRAVVCGDGPASAALAFKGGVLAASAAGTLIGSGVGFTVEAGERGGVIDAGGNTVTIAADIVDAPDESGTLTFGGAGGTVQVAGDLRYTGATRIGNRTHLIVKDAAAKDSLLANGLVAVAADGGFDGATCKILSIADGTGCTESDCARISRGAGLSGARLAIVDGAIALTAAGDRPSGFIVVVF